MKQTWRKLLTAFCAASMLMTLPGVSVYAADTDYESIVESIEAVRDETEMDGGFLEEGSVYEEPEFAAEVVESSDDISASTDIDEDPAEDAVFADAETPDPEEQEDSAETIDLPEEHSLLSEDVFEEESIGDYGYYVVGDGVAALYDSDTGSITLRASNNRTLWRDWLERAGIDRESVKSISVVQTASTNTASKVKLPADSSSVFSKLVNLTALDLKGFDTSNVENMTGMFRECYNLKTLDLSGFNTSKVTNMGGMFYYSNNLTMLNLKGWDTSNVTDMGMMFCMCESLKALDLTGFNTSNVTDMRDMFSSCIALTSLDLSSFNVKKVTDMRGMFASCQRLKSLDVSSFNTSNVTEMRRIFSGCKSLTKLDLKGFDISKLVDARDLFSSCESLTRLDLRSFSTANVELMSYMFQNCSKLKYLDLGSFDMSKVKDAVGMFEGCKALEILITPKNRKNTSECYFSHPMYDRNGKVYYQLPVNSPSMVLGKTKALAASIFIDVRDPSHPYYDAIYWAAGKGITKGYSDGTFGINRSCTRGEMIMFLWRYAGKPIPRAVRISPFKDVPKTHTFFSAILWAYQKGITKGYADGTFGVNRNVTRGESMMFLWRLKGKPVPMRAMFSPFKDVPMNHPFYKAILWGYQKKVTTGYTTGRKKGTFGINENCTRGQIVTFLYRARNL